MAWDPEELASEVEEIFSSVSEPLTLREAKYIAKLEAKRKVNDRARDRRGRKHPGKSRPLTQAERTCKCPICDKEFVRKPGRGRAQIYCSRPCKLRANHPQERTPLSIESKMYTPDLRKCRICGLTTSVKNMKDGICNDGWHDKIAGKKMIIDHQKKLLKQMLAAETAPPPPPKQSEEDRLRYEFKINVEAIAEKERERIREWNRLHPDRAV